MFCNLKSYDEKMCFIYVDIKIGEEFEQNISWPVWVWPLSLLVWLWLVWVWVWPLVWRVGEENTVMCVDAGNACTKLLPILWYCDYVRILRYCDIMWVIMWGFWDIVILWEWVCEDFGKEKNGLTWKRV